VYVRPMVVDGHVRGLSGVITALDEQTAPS
jgi:hypothetical protein